MKKLFAAACLVLCTAAAANAQWFVGGSIHFSETSSRSETTYSWEYGESGQLEIYPVMTTFAISPRVGYMFNDRWLAGLGVGYEFQKQNRDEINEYSIKANGISVRPFVRCNVLWFGPCMLGFEASGSFSYAKAKDDREWNKQDHMRRMYGGEIAPVLELDVSKNLSLECRLNFFSFGYYHTREKTVLVDDDSTYRHESSSNEATGIFSGDEVFRLGDLTFGVIYKF